LAAGEGDTPAPNAAAMETQALEQRQQALADAERSLDAAARTMDEAHQAIAEGKAGEQKDIDLVRQELSRAHRQLQEASREVARAHRTLALGTPEDKVIRIVIGDQAVIGIVLGTESTAGIELAGVSPDGPAERAGLRQKDVLTSIGGVDLTGQTEGGARDALFALMDNAEPGVELPVEVLRDGDLLTFSVVPEKREPSAWQSLIRLPVQGPLPPMPPMPPMQPIEPGSTPMVAPLDPLVAEAELHSELVNEEALDDEELALRVQEITERAREFEYMFTGEDGETVQFSRTIKIDGAPMSELGNHALAEADIWFDLPRTRGLELTSLNPELGKYFKADKGVLVIEASTDNTYGLESGDVITAVGATEVSSPGDLLRALRDGEPGAEVEFTIKRDRKTRTLKAVIPEGRLGLLDMPSGHRHRMPPLPPPNL